MYQKIVVGTDGSASAGVAVDAAIELARLSGAELHVVHAHKVLTAYQLAGAAEIGVAAGALVESNEVNEADGQKVCDRVVDRAGRVGVAASGHCVAGDPADALIGVATDVAADLLVVGSKGMVGARRFVMGSVPNKVSHHCPASLLIVDTTQPSA